jgi:hypothetical protein
MSTHGHILSRLSGHLRRRPGFLLGPALIAALGTPSGALAMDSAFVRSLLLPGTGQAHKGHYTKAVIFGGAAIISATGLFASQIQYNQSVDTFYDQKTTYDALAAELYGGGMVSVEDIDAAYAGMTNANDEAESRLKWRNFFLTTLVATYALNLVDVLVTKPHDPETALRIEASPERVFLTKGFRF